MILLMFERIPTIDSLSISALVGLILLLWSASSFFRKLKSFLEKAWDVKSAESNGVKDFTRDAVMASTITIFFGGLLVISIIIEGVIYMGSSWFDGIWPLSSIIGNYAGPISSFLILVLLFMLIYRVLPDKSLNLKSIFVGSIVTVILISIGKYAVGLSLKYSNPTSVYGAIGSIIGLFLLIFYISMMITIGIEFTKVYSES
jgi:membrane protein